MGYGPVSTVRQRTGCRQHPTALDSLEMNPRISEPLPSPPADKRDQQVDSDLFADLEKRLGRLHARLRYGIEQDFEGRIFGGGINFFHIENWYSIHSLIKNALKLAGLYWRGVRNAANVQVTHNRIEHPSLPKPFSEYTILQVSDLHVDISPLAMQRLAEILKVVRYDVCVLTGDYRGQTYGPYGAALAGLARVRAQIAGPVYGVLGNHDTICMVPALEKMGIRMLLNESVAIERDGARIHLAGIDDAHYYRVDNIEKAMASIPASEFSVLLSHTPEIYRQAAHAQFNVMLSGHTHGGQICLPGGIPIELNAVLPRRMGCGPWKHHSLIGYTSTGAGSSLVPVRFNCLPEIVLHRLERG